MFVHSFSAAEVQLLVGHTHDVLLRYEFRHPFPVSHPCPDEAISSAVAEHLSRISCDLLHTALDRLPVDRKLCKIHVPCDELLQLLRLDATGEHRFLGFIPADQLFERVGGHVQLRLVLVPFLLMVITAHLVGAAKLQDLPHTEESLCLISAAHHGLQHQLGVRIPG